METGETPKVFDRNLCPISCCLKNISLSGNRIRYLNVSKLMCADLSSSLDMKSGGFPLFLGKDVFASCNLTQNNVQRIHARYSKEGLATKITFDDFRINGMTQNKVWFYSIQGLFHVIFYYFKKDVQKDCLKILSDIWLQHSDDSILSEAITLRLDEESARINLSSLGPAWRDIELVNKQSSDRNKHCSSNTHLNHKSLSQHSSGNKVVSQIHLNSKSVQVLPEREYLNERKHPSIKKKEIYLNMSTQTDNLNSNMSTQTEEFYTGTVDRKEDNVRQTNNTAVQTDEIFVILENDSNYNINEENISKHPHVITNNREQKIRMEMKKTKNHCEQTHELVNGHKQSENKPPAVKCPYCVYLNQENRRLHPDLTNCLIKLNQFLMFMYSETDEDFLTLFCDVICVFLDHYPNIILPFTFSTELLEEFRGCHSDISKNEIHDKFLNFICKYVGKELNKFDAQISDKVVMFKENHIKCIDNLPPPEEIIDDIFPLCMKELIYHWMNSQKEFDNLDMYTPQQKRLRASSSGNTPDFQIIQLILEFVNNALISGVAHVVYSRIRAVTY
ncbi:uncharacterized protein LOC143074253 [Mytilus galloprovincialis]|uniref:uncharacterized protein LOC143074253 n=1 Tax=Mytilus galloprovincialis TaxID=29158 RepID=UPI003F7BACD1